MFAGEDNRTDAALESARAAAAAVGAPVLSLAAIGATVGLLLLPPPVLVAEEAEVIDDTEDEEAVDDGASSAAACLLLALHMGYRMQRQEKAVAARFAGDLLDPALLHYSNLYLYSTERWTKLLIAVMDEGLLGAGRVGARGHLAASGLVGNARLSATRAVDGNKSLPAH
jgi:hypothetical protein